MHRVGEVEDDKAILFRYGDLGVGKDVYYIRKCGLFSRGKERGPVLTGHDESPTVMDNCMIKPEDNAQLSYIFTLSSQCERSSLPLGCWVPQ